jgi:hypothetical protein
MARSQAVMPLLNVTILIRFARLDLLALHPVVPRQRRSAERGRLNEAETLFARSVARSDNPEALRSYGAFLLREVVELRQK